jgi:hypothetical protein
VKLSFVLVLIVSALLGASETNPSSAQPIAEKEKSLSKEQKATSNQDQDGAKNVPSSNLDKPSAAITTQKTESNKESAAKSIPSITDWIMVGITTAYAIFALFQWLAIRRQANITERTITHLERPWLIVRPNTPENWPFHIDYAITKFPINIAVMSSVGNVGRSPAFLVQQHINVVVASIPSETDQPQYTEPKPFAELLIEPKGVHSQRAGKNITEAEFKSIITGQQCIVFFGFVKYFDVSRKVEHCTRFCSYWHKRPNDIGTDRWAFSPVGPRNYVEYT